MSKEDKKTQEELLHYRHPIELWSDRWNHTGAMIRTIVGILALTAFIINSFF